MNRLLTLESFPYLLTLIIAIIGFQINYLIKVTVETPTIKYELSEASEKEIGNEIEREYTCSIKNITDNASFKDIEISFVFKEEDAEIYGQDVEVIPPSALSNVESTSLNRQIVSYFIKHLHPEFEYVLKFKSKMKKGTNYKPGLYIQSSNTITLRNKSIRTWLVENHSAINLTILGLFIIISIVYMVILSKIKKDQK